MSGRVNTKVYWNAGLILDVVHMPLVILTVFLGAVWFSGPVYVTIVVIGVSLQIATLSCPVMALTGWLKQKHDPTFENNWSFTFWLYQRYGALVGLPVFFFFLGAALLVRTLL